MYQNEVVLCSSSFYNKKYYFNEDFAGLPEQIRKELKIMCVLYTEEVGGVIIVKFAEDGTLMLEAEAKEDDILFDEIGSGLKIRQMQIQKKDLFQSLEMYYKVFFLGEELEG